MTAVEVRCPTCDHGYVDPSPGLAWMRCASCDGVCRVWASGAPTFGCTLKLGGRIPGEVVTLGNGDRGRVLWHLPTKRPVTTFLGVFDAFDGLESHTPVAYPSCVGVSVIDLSRVVVVVKASDRTRDITDPLQRLNATLNLRGQ